VDHRLQMEGLGKQVGESQDRISYPVAAARAGREPVLPDRKRRKSTRLLQLRQQPRDLRANSGAWRVYNDKVGAFAFLRDVESRRPRHSQRSCCARRFCLRAAPLKADSTAITRAKPSVSFRANSPTPQTRPGERAFLFRSDFIHQLIHQPPIHLKESAVVHAIVEPAARYARNGSPICNRARRLNWARAPARPSSTSSRLSLR